MTALGVLAADLIWASASVVGLTALPVSSQLAFDAIRRAGAAYLIYLAVRLVLTRTFDPVGTDQVAVKRIGVAQHRAFTKAVSATCPTPRPCSSTPA